LVQKIASVAISEHENFNGGVSSVFHHLWDEITISRGMEWNRASSYRITCSTGMQYRLGDLAAAWAWSCVWWQVCIMPHYRPIGQLMAIIWGV